ncbi:MAG: glycosyltransferase [Oscillospiraceae bacterium]|nr:glycosyltransferase [Oscillospiraceae bacterium]
MNPLVSIVIPVYNGSDFLEEAIDSALSQTYSNIEVIVVNDGSTDNTAKIAMQYGSKIRYFEKENGGVATALNMAIENMSGEYFSWLSHDDLYMPEKIEKNILALSERGISKRQIVYSAYMHIDEEGSHISTINARTAHLEVNTEYWLFPLLTGMANGCTLMIHRSHFEKHGVFKVELECVQDFELWHRMFRDERLVYVDEPLIKSRIHKRQTGQTSDKAIPEGLELWHNMLASLTKDEIYKLAETEQDFWNRQAAFLMHTPYGMLTEYCQRRFAEGEGNCDKEQMSKARLNIFARLDSAVKLHGIMGVLKLLLKKIMTKLFHKHKG